MPREERESTGERTVVLGASNIKGVVADEATSAGSFTFDGPNSRDLAARCAEEDERAWLE